ncbi:anti-FecI sigma factor, FecR [Fibrisoma limi BUZ 3]|uniref:Anti-FecI sigma factor, FecR n=1 Tax=Fibrisoma limi BUZ 3 TaxID=1185876 RepID=I2GCX7_9BACT|nr:FecR family protein [Fibrisoma limi]CCH51751.1 anti-FecI sigma factor, FecR [Fibrisoma limi BUZ 3]
MDFPPETLSSVEDFLANDAFRKWMLERRPEDQLDWQRWLAQHPEKKPLYEQAVATFLVVQGKRIKISDREVKRRTEIMLNQLPDAAPVVKPLINWRWGGWAAAAAVAGLVVWWQVSGLPPNPLTDTRKADAQQNEGWKVVRNTTGQALIVLLPDKSSVLLSTDSQLRFHKQMQQAVREVFLEGEGFFEVMKDSTKPFVVYTPTLTTKVLGTSFQVRSFMKEAIAYVKVKTGQVTVVSTATPDKIVSLKGNEEVNLETANKQFVKQKILTVTNTAPILKQQFTFEYTPVPEVFARLEENYHVSIRYDRNRLSNCTFTGQLNDIPFLEKIRLICMATESTYEFVDNQITIQGLGCN